MNGQSGNMRSDGWTLGHTIALILCLLTVGMLIWHVAGKPGMDFF